MATPFLMFVGDQYGRAHEAIQYYLATFSNSHIDEIVFYGDDEPQAGNVKTARFRLNGKSVMAADAPGEHGFGFTPALSLFIDCEDRDQQAQLYTELAKDGQIMMPLDDYGFSQQFAWVADKLGVSWQLNLA